MTGYEIVMSAEVLGKAVLQEVHTESLADVSEPDEDGLFLIWIGAICARSAWSFIVEQLCNRAVAIIDSRTCLNDKITMCI